MIRITGAAFIFLASSFFGLYLSDGIKKKRIRLEKLISMLDETATMIRWNGLTLREIFRELSREAVFSELGFVKKFSENCCNGMAVPEAWSEAVKTDVLLSAEEKQLLAELGSELGTTDKEGQLSVIGLYRERLCRMLEEETEKYRVKGKMYRSLGITAGAMIGIILI